ncbi:putative transcriptional regulator domain protein, partial [Acinetobacter baumannii 554515]
MPSTVFIGFAVPFFLPKKYLIYKQQEFITV